MTKSSYIDFKVLPFKGAQGDVPGHEIRCHHYDWMGVGNGIEYVVVEAFDTEAGMKLDHVLHWQYWTQYAKKKWPSGNSVIAVLLRDGQRVRAEGLSINHTDTSYEAVPIVCRDIFQIVMGGGSRTPLVEVVGVLDCVVRGKPMVDPWVRDSQQYADRMIYKPV